jgi:hypothetical protein
MTPGDDAHRAAIRARVAEELATPVRPGVEWLAREIAARHGDSVAGVLFYGSCLRKQTDEGVLDYWVVVDDYRSAHARTSHALANHVAPPSVYYVEREWEGTTLRTKYGVLDRRAFDRGTRLDAWHPYVWARFAQPARLIACRDESARGFFEEAVTSAIVTFVARLFCHLPDRGGLLRFSLAAFWQQAFRRTYDSERRPEADDSIRGLYLEDTARYDEVATHALHHLARIGFLDEAMEHPRSFSVTVAPARLARLRARWRLMRAYSRSLGLLRLFKTAFTFGDWVPYVLWKLERHTGRRIELTPRQRRHPLVFAWPVILPLLRQRNLR